MSTSGQEDQIGEISKDDESEISSTTPDDGGIKPSESGPSNTASEAIPSDAYSTAESSAPTCEDGVTEGVDHGISYDKQVIDVAPTTAKIDDKDNKTEVMEAESGNGDQITPTIPLEENANNEVILPQEINKEHKPSFSKEIPDKIQANADKDSSSLGEDLELKLEDEDAETKQTADILKLLDKELGIDTSNKPQEVNVETVKFIDSVGEKNEPKNVIEDKVDSSIILESIKDTDKTFEDDKSSDSKNVKQDVELPSDNTENSDLMNSHSGDGQSNVENIETHDSEDVEMAVSTSFEESENIIREIDNLILNTDVDIEMENVTNVPAETPQITDQVASSTDENKDQDIDMEKDIISEKKIASEKTSMEVAEIRSESPPEEIKDMNVDTIPEIRKDPLISEENIPTETYPKKNKEEDEEKAFSKEYLNDVVLTNKNVVQKPIEIAIMNVSETSDKVNDSSIKEQASKTIDTDMVKGQSTQFDIPSSLPVEVSSINDKVELENKDTQTSKHNSEAISNEQLEKDNQTDDKINFDIQKSDESQNIEDIDTSNSQENDSILDTSITPNVHHRINKPNVMIDIPTQELSDIEAELDDDDFDYNEEKIMENKTHRTKIDSTETDTKGSTIDVNIKELKDIDTKKSKDIDNKELKDVKTETLDTVTTSVAKVTSPIIEIDATSSILNITSVSPTKPNLISTKSTQDLPKSLQFDATSTPIVNTLQEQKLTTSNLEQDISDEKQLTKLDNIIDKPVTSEQTDDKEDPSTSKNGDEKLSSPKEMQIDDVKPSTSKINQGTDDEKPCTSKDVPLLKTLMPDDTDETEEVTDSLGLLAESSRVMDDENDDDDDDADYPEADDNDDDEDFDPYDETNSEIADDMEDSNTPPPEFDPKDLEKPGPSSKLLEERESDEGTMDIADGTIDIADGPMDIVDDIECVENELQGLNLPDDAISETPSTEENAGKDEPEIIDADTHKETPKATCQPNRIINILEKVLGRKTLTATPKPQLKTDVRNYVEVEGSSDSDDVLEVSKSDDPESSDVISVNIPKGVEVMSTSGPRSTSEILSKEGEITISGVPKPPPHKMSKINTSEVSIKTTGSFSPAMHIPETIVNKKALKDEIFNLDSDEEDTKKETSDKCKLKGTKRDSPKLSDRKCVNPECTSESRTYYQADRATVAYYSLTRRSAAVCEECREQASQRSEVLMNGIKDLRPLLELELDAPSHQLVEISDSDSDEDVGDDTDYVGEKGAQFLEEHLADMFNETWIKYKMESRLKDTEDYLMEELEKIEADAKEIDIMLDDCQTKTDAIRIDFYKDYELRSKSVGAIIIHDTPFSSYSHTERDIEEATPSVSSRYPKRRAASVASDTPAKRPAIPLGYSPLQGSHKDSSGDQIKADDDKEDISVVKLSAESAPADLPPCGEIVRPPLKTGMTLYAMRNAFGTWLKGRIMEVQPKQAGQQFTNCRVKFEHKVKNPCKVLAARCLAYPEPSEVRMTIGTRVVALFKDPQNSTRRESFYSGVIAEIPNPVNNYRYLVFFDDGYAQYVHHQDTRIVCESSNLVWEEVHPFIRDFICNYLLSYPERPMVRLHAGEKLKTEWNGKWWDSKVLKVDASIALINFDEDNRTEWIYRGSTRLAPLYLELKAAEKAGEGRVRSRLPRSKAQMRSNMPCVEYMRSDEQAKTTAETQSQRQHYEELRRQRAVAKKSTTAPAVPPVPAAEQGAPYEGVISRVVYYTPKNVVKPYKMSAHNCTIKCRRSDLLSLKDLRTYNPLAKPLLSGWERQTVRYKLHRWVAYRAPCGRRLRSMQELHRYLRILQSDLAVDLFDFTPGTHCLAEFVLHKCIVSKKDLSHGKESVPVPCVNYYDDSLPEFCSYNTERTPTAGVPLNLDPEFLCGCDCTDDCMDKSKCACWKMTLEGARTIGLNGPNVGYVYRRLPEPLPSGIYECNSRCKCKQTCLNRVAQHPLQLKLQVFKTVNRGWGIRALNDIPKGSFVCIYAGNLLTDATANLDGLNEGDEYLAELDYIEVVEGMKEGYEEDISKADKKLDKKNGSSASESDPTSESEDERDLAIKDDDFQPGYIPQLYGNLEFKKSLRRREKAKKKEEQEKQEVVKKRDDCITISDDEEVREPSRFTAQAGMVDKDLISKHSSRVSVRTLYGKDEACYIMDAKVQGNIGRYLNHSCHPNVFVQNVFVDTHDPRFPWVAFFALSLVRAGTELTWNYNYDIGSVPEKVLYCYCGAPNCRGRLL